MIFVFVLFCFSSRLFGFDTYVVTGRSMLVNHDMHACADSRSERDEGYPTAYRTPVRN